MHISTFLILTVLLSGALSGCSRNNDNVVEASGTIEGTDTRISSEVMGKINEIRVSEGARVTKGDTLVVVDGTEYQLQLRQALANEAAAEAQYRLAVQGSRSEDIAQAEAALQSARKDYERMQELLGTQTVTQKQFDDAEARYVATEQTYQKLVRGLRRDEIAVAQARFEQSSAQADQLRKKARDCHILAPGDGVVTLRAVEPGELVMPGSHLLRITNLDKVNLTIYVNQLYVAKLRIGHAARVSIDNEGVRGHEGRVIYISPNAEFTPKNIQTKEERTKLVFAVKIEVDNPDGVLKPGLPADATIDLSDSL